MRESRSLEFKRDVTNTFLKTVSAFANYDGGSILFGVDDTGEVVGVGDPIGKCLDIENKINDSITPCPQYSMQIHESGPIIELKVSGGFSKPYLYRSKAYRRSDSATVEVDNVELMRLILDGKNLSYEQLPADNQDLTFEYLGDAMLRHLGLEAFDDDTLKTLGLLSERYGFNNAAAILADSSAFPGVDMARFGESINVILRRVTSEGKSALSVFNEAIDVFRDLYCYEEIVGEKRRTVELIPIEAFREAIANALVHRTWDVSARIRISMFDDRIEVASPGGLPTGISKEEYLSGVISIRRNPILANVFYRLGIIEAFGTGVLRIRQAYGDSVSKPRFDVEENSITVILPTLRSDLGLSDDQRLVYELLSPTRAKASGEILEGVRFSRSKLRGIIGELVDRGLAVAVGTGRGRKYLRG